MGLGNNLEFRGGIVSTSCRQYTTGAAAIAVTTPVAAPSGAWQLIEVRLHLDAVGGAAENFTVTLDSSAGAPYDLLLFTQAMAAVTDILWQPTRPIVLTHLDSIDFAYTNSNGRTYGLEVIWQGGG